MIATSQLTRICKQIVATLALPAVVGMFVANTALAAPPLPGAIFTTDSACGGVNLNIYALKTDVYLDGGPAHIGSAGLAPGSYYVQVTDPGGTVLGSSLTTVVTVLANGEFAQCYQLSAIVFSALSSFTTAGYDDTPNPGGEYKVWVSNDPAFLNNSTKTDNFKVPPCVENCGGRPPQGVLTVIKFYDANANGLNDDGQLITGWKVRIVDDINIVRETPVIITLAADTYSVTEFNTVETTWVHTTPTTVQVTLGDLGTGSVEFGNLCLGAGGGLTLGFWSNKNGQALVGADDLTLLANLNLRNGDGSNFDPTTYAQLRTWLLSATAVNMAYMLSAQLAAMELNVYNGKVSGTALIYAPGTTSANGLGFATVNAVMDEANTELGLHGLTLSGSPDRAHQEALKNALDNANNNKTFVQPTPCAFTFAE